MPRTTLRAGLEAAALLAACASPLFAQTTPADEGRLQRLESRLDELERRHQSELADRDRQIAELRSQLRVAPAATSRSTDPEAALLDEIDAAPTEPASAGGGREILDLSRRAAEVDAAGRSRAPVSFNPDIAVVSDFLGSFSSNRGNDALNRADVREVELDLRAAVHPNADAVAILAFERDAENPVFPEAGEESEGVEGSVNIEEAYLFLHNFGVPNLTARLGRFHLRFGRQNLLHLHDLPTSDPPLVNQAFLAPEALTDSGISLSYVVPPRLVGNQYVEVIGEVITGEGAGTESPTLRGDLSVDSPAFNTHVLWNHDLSSAWNLEIGGSWLTGKASDINSQSVNLYGVDVTLIHTDPTGGFFNQLFQAEAIYGDTYDEDGVHRNAWGAYLLGQQQIGRDYFVGARLDYTQDPNSDHDEAYAINPYVSFYWSEFLRFRLQYQHKFGDVPTENNVFLQATWIFGAHPPHPYWAMR